MINSADITFQMLEDWRNVDLNSITKQTLYTMEDSQEEHRQLIIHCRFTQRSRRSLTRCQRENYTLPPHKQHTEGAIIPTTSPVGALMAESKRLNKFTPLSNTPPSISELS